MALIVVAVVLLAYMASVVSVAFVLVLVCISLCQPSRLTNCCIAALLAAAFACSETIGFFYMLNMIQKQIRVVSSMIRLGSPK